MKKYFAPARSRLKGGVRDLIGRNGTKGGSFDVGIGAVDAVVGAAALGLEVEHAAPLGVEACDLAADEGPPERSSRGGGLSPLPDPVMTPGMPDGSPLASSASRRRGRRSPSPMMP